jgi:ABC-type oligopeptide transport system substrate-binding subunit
LNGIWINPLDQTDRELQSAISMCIDRAYLNSKVNYSVAFPAYQITQAQADANAPAYSPELPQPCGQIGVGR